MKKSIFHKLFTIAFRGAIGLVVLSVLSVILFKWVPVPVTPLMIIRKFDQKQEVKKVVVSHKWVSMDKISPLIQLAAVSSEDQNFINHNGFDFEAVKKAYNESKEGNERMRGASTISQQTAKNVFLWPRRSWVRKGLEVWFTGLIELFWSKKRILEVYLNSIEMGNGIYGVEAAARNYFGTTAYELTRYQSALIIAVLPNPRKWSAANPGPYVQSRTEWILSQMNMQAPLPW